MGSPGDAYGNAMAESFVATLECELLPNQSHVEARLAIFRYIEGLYNPSPSSLRTRTTFTHHL